MHFDKITARITKLSYGLNPEFCDPVSPPTVPQPPTIPPSTVTQFKIVGWPMAVRCKRWSGHACLIDSYLRLPLSAWP